MKNTKEKKMIALEMPKALYDQLVSISGDRCASVSGTIRFIVLDYIKRNCDEETFKKVKEML